MVGKKIIDAIESAGWYFEEHNDYYEIRSYSPMGEDLLTEIEKEWTRGTDEGLVDELRNIYECFDPEDHAVMWYEADRRGQPDSLKDLLDDANDIKEMYEELYESAFKALQNKSKRRL